MGYEYQITFARPPGADLDQVLRHAPHFASFDAAFQLYNYRSDLNEDPKAMPDAAAKIEQNGIYFVYNGGTGAARTTFGYIIQKLAGFGTLTIHEL